MKLTKVLIIVLTSFICTILPLLIRNLTLSDRAISYTSANNLVFELFGFFVSITIIAFAYFELEKQKTTSLKTALPIVIPLLVCLFFLLFVTEYSLKSTDYIAYEDATKALLDGQNPYENLFGRKPYIYPPLFVQIMVFVYYLIANLSGLLMVNNENPINLVFYFYQCGQFFMVVLAYFLSYKLARILQLRKITSLFIVTSIFLFNYPIFRTFIWNQVNLWLLNSFLLAIILLKRSPLISGIAVALGSHLKIYPLILLLPWTIAKRFKVVFMSFLSFILIVLIQTNWGSDWNLWEQFFLYFRDVQKPTLFRNNSIYSFVFNCFDLIGIPTTLVNKTVFLIILTICIWLVWRFWQREKIYSQFVQKTNNPNSKEWLETWRLYGHSMDGIALSLLISPSVWEHHYVLAIPLAIWAIANCRPNRLKQVTISIFLIFCLPIFDIFPFSYHRLAGLIWLMFLTEPKKMFVKVFE